MTLKERAQRAEAIAADPADYKICEGCGSIISRPTPICPVCKCYRFDDDPARVAEHAVLLGSRPATTISEEDW
jgi:hypothetical protein